LVQGRVILAGHDITNALAQDWCRRAVEPRDIDQRNLLIGAAA